MIILGLLVSVLAFGTFIFAYMRPTVEFEGGEIFEAELLPEEDLFSLTVAELKEKLAEQGLPVSGNKGELIARLTTQTA